MKTENKDNPFEIEDLLDGRWGLKKDGLVIKVAYSKKELEEWMFDKYIKSEPDNHVGPYWRK